MGLSFRARPIAGLYPRTEPLSVRTADRPRRTRDLLEDAMSSVSVARLHSWIEARTESCAGPVIGVVSSL